MAHPTPSSHSPDRTTPMPRRTDSKRTPPSSSWTPNPVILLRTWSPILTSGQALKHVSGRLYVFSHMLMSINQRTLGTSSTMPKAPYLAGALSQGRQTLSGSKAVAMPRSLTLAAVSQRGCFPISLTIQSCQSRAQHLLARNPSRLCSIYSIPLMLSLYMHRCSSVSGHVWRPCMCMDCACTCAPVQE